MHCPDECCLCLCAPCAGLDPTSNGCHCAEQCAKPKHAGINSNHPPPNSAAAQTARSRRLMRSIRANKNCHVPTSKRTPPSISSDFPPLGQTASGKFFIARRHVLYPHHSRQSTQIAVNAWYRRFFIAFTRPPAHCRDDFSSNPYYP